MGNISESVSININLNSTIEAALACNKCITQLCWGPWSTTKPTCLLFLCMANIGEEGVSTWPLCPLLDAPWQSARQIKWLLVVGGATTEGDTRKRGFPPHVILEGGRCFSMTTNPHSLTCFLPFVFLQLGIRVVNRFHLTHLLFQFCCTGY